jgi:hypothetical protein
MIAEDEGGKQKHPGLGGWRCAFAEAVCSRCANLFKWMKPATHPFLSE